MPTTKRPQFVDFRAVKVTMEQILDHYGLTEQFKRGDDSFSGSCPIHKGTNLTQFRVSISKNCWNCFGDCQRGGNILDFVSLMEQVNVREAAVRIAEQYLCKDHVFLLERYYYFLEGQNESGLIVMDETEKTEDRRFVQRLERYFTSTQTGRYRRTRIVPSPFFVSSDMTYPVQAADVCIYCINFGFRLPAIGMNAPVRTEIEAEFRKALADLQFQGEGYREGKVYRSFGIAFVPDPYGKIESDQ